MAQMRYCCISSCEHNRGTSSKDVRLFYSPTNDEALLLKWRNNVEKHQNTKIIGRFKICELHFEESAMTRTKLKKDAVPTVFPTYIPAAVPKEREYCSGCLHLDVQMQGNKCKIDTQKSKIDELNEIYEERQKLIDQLTSVLGLQETAVLQVNRRKTKIECAVCQANITPNDAHICNGDKEIQCEYCHQPFKSTAMLMKHLDASHVGKVVYKCDQCRKAAYSMKILLEWHRQCHPATELKPTFATPLDLEAHVDEAHSNKSIPQTVATTFKPYQCGKCNEMFVEPFELESHIATEHKVYTYECYICKRKFSTESYLRRHFNTHNRKKKCVVCLSVIHQLEFEQHMCDGLDTVQCTYCQGNFNQMNSLLQHLEVHEGKIITHRCQQCRKSFKMALLKDVHMKSHQRNMHKCNSCYRSFATVEKVQKHQIVHTLPNDHLCDQCGKGFKRKSNLIVHKCGVKSFNCTQCDKKFTLSSELTKHMYEHEDVKL